MRSQTNRKAIIISALVTAFALTLATGGLLLSNRLSANATAPAQKQPAATTAPLAQPATDSATLAAQPADSAADSAAVAAAYEAQLQAAYRALQDAYDQINALQAAQNQTVTNFAPGFEHEHDHEGDHD